MNLFEFYCSLGCAILTFEGGVPYMCKFAVDPEAQGQGLFHKKNFLCAFVKTRIVEIIQ